MTGTFAATRCSPSTPTAACCASTNRPAGASPSPLMRPAAIRSSTRTPAHSWPSRRRTATSPSPAPPRWPSPTASISGRPKIPGSCGSSRRRSEDWPTAALRWVSRSPAVTSASTTRPARPRSSQPPWSGYSALSMTYPGVSQHISAPSRVRSLMLIGDTSDEFDGSVWAQVTADHLGGRPPAVDLQREQLLADVLAAASRDGLVSAAHDLSEGGLIQAVVESALAGETGCRIVVPDGLDPFVTSVLRIRRTCVGRRSAYRGEPLSCDVRGAGIARRPDRRRRPGCRPGRSPRPVHGVARRIACHIRGRAAGALRR